MNLRFESTHQLIQSPFSNISKEKVTKPIFRPFKSQILSKEKKIYTIQILL